MDLTVTNGSHDEVAEISRRYERFATVEASVSSPHYEYLALEVARSAEALSFLASLPADRRQPNLFLAAVRYVGGLPEDGVALNRILQTQGARVREVVLSRRTQTNEPARCSVILPALALFQSRPLALIEVGASAGLCLLGDRYGYDYGRHKIPPPALLADSSPTFTCQANASVPLPAAHPEVVWRAGLDLNPVNVGIETETAWLETLVWPGQEIRLQGLRAAIKIARRDPPRVYRGNLLTDLPAIAALAPRQAQLVVFHTAVLAYVNEQSNRDRFLDTVRGTGAVWISNEAQSVFPEIIKRAPTPPSAGHFLLSVNGEPVGWTGPHGQSLDWFR